MYAEPSLEPLSVFSSGIPMAASFLEISSISSDGIAVKHQS